MTLPFHEVDVPIRNTAQPGLSGVHVFTGRADSRSAAVRIAHEVYDAAHAAREAGLEVPHGRPDGWGACGYRPGWELNWPAATVGQWNDPYSWTGAERLRAVATPRDSRSAWRLDGCPGPIHPV